MLKIVSFNLQVISTRINNAAFIIKIHTNNKTSKNKIHKSHYSCTSRLKSIPYSHASQRHDYDDDAFDRNMDNYIQESSINQNISIQDSYDDYEQYSPCYGRSNSNNNKKSTDQQMNQTNNQDLNSNSYFNKYEYDTSLNDSPVNPYQSNYTSHLGSSTMNNQNSTQNNTRLYQPIKMTNAIQAIQNKPKLSMLQKQYNYNPQNSNIQTSLQTTDKNLIFITRLRNRYFLLNDS